MLKGQLLLALLSSGKGNTIRPRAITADEQGRVYVAGVSACCIADRDALSFNGAAVADYAGGDPWVLVLSADLRTRHLWFTAANGGRGEALGIAVSRGLAVLGSRRTSAAGSPGAARSADFSSWQWASRELVGGLTKRRPKRCRGRMALVSGLLFP